MDLSQRKEQFSVAYLSVVVTTAGYNLYQPRVDHDSVDWEITARRSEELARRPRIDVQLKCTQRAEPFADEAIRFPVKRKNYEDLRDDLVMVPRILVVVLVPRQLRDWLHHSEEELALRHCGYWVSLRGLPSTPNRQTVTVPVPRSQQFTVEALQQMMKRINDGGLP
jgi:hypothetical protein